MNVRWQVLDVPEGNFMNVSVADAGQSRRCRNRLCPRAARTRETGPPARFVLTRRRVRAYRVRPNKRVLVVTIVGAGLRAPTSGAVNGSTGNRDGCAGLRTDSMVVTH